METSTKCIDCGKPLKGGKRCSFCNIRETNRRTQYKEKAAVLRAYGYKVKSYEEAVKEEE